LQSYFPRLMTKAPLLRGGITTDELERWLELSSPYPLPLIAMLPLCNIGAISPWYVPGRAIYGLVVLILSPLATTRGFLA
jgi:hypothetical protein